MRSFIIKTLFFFAGISFFTNASTQSSRETEQLDKIIEKIQLEKNIPSISYALLRDQKLLYSNAIGFADVDKKIKATDTTAYSIASLTKPVAATLIMRLAQEGKIDIDKKMKDYWPAYTAHFSEIRELFTKELPWLKPYIENYHFNEYDITVRQHLSHTSEFVPGTRYKYNGFLFGRLVNVIDNIVEAKFIGLMDSCIIKKLGMKYAFLQFTDMQNTPGIGNLAKPYLHSGDRLIKKNFPDPQTLNAGAGLICSVKDFAKFDIAFDQNELVNADTKTKMLNPSKSPDGSLFPYGLGWFVSSFKDQIVWYHYGLQDTYSAVYIKLPEKNITIILFSNSSALTLAYNTAFQSGHLEQISYVKEILEIF